MVEFFIAEMTCITAKKSLLWKKIHILIFLLPEMV